ncbi:hypothetical protein [Agrobacterium sp. Azo12]|uniref:hypothetical protein n=1 Tax=Agrobacterium sp. Azo12 TaxID=3031129 RepID=UPI0023D7D155|nr:hypothetical protein [Agrobacterium sp. Azo12]MDO5895129.1 hypothetical protein [Agrobacterium sp. Azo12]
MAQNAAQVFRDYVVQGVPSSGPHNPVKAEIRSLIGGIESLVNTGGLGGATWKETRALLAADLAHDADDIGVVYDDPSSENNGLYTKVGAAGTGSWRQITTFLPGYQFITASDDGESIPNAYSMNTSPRLPYADGVALVEFVVPETNTSSTVTISFDGAEPLTIKTASGNSPAIGGLIEGMPISGVKVGPNFYMRSDQASAALLTQAEGLLLDMQDELASAVINLTEQTEPIRDAAQAAATDAQMYAEMVGAAVYDFNFDSDPSTPGYDWND